MVFVFGDFYELSGKGGFFTTLYNNERIPPLKYTFQLSREEHWLLAIQASDMYQFGSPYRVTAARTVIFSGRTGLGDRHRWRGVVRATSSASVGEKVVAVNKNVG